MITTVSDDSTEFIHAKYAYIFVETLTLIIYLLLLPNTTTDEIHCVKCLAIDETPVLIDQSLRELQTEIDDKIPDIDKKAYIHSQLNAKGRSFVNSKEFRLRFLRSELFDIQKTAISMLIWLESALSLFGSVALERPICISTDFLSHEQKVFRKGCIQLLPVRASGTGRRIICFIPYDEDWYTISNNVRQKIMMYIFWVVGNDIDAQRKGVAVIILFDSSFPQIPDHKGAGVISPSDQWILSVRMSAIHICTPDIPFFRLRRSFIAMAIGSHNRSRLRLHLGTPIELRYILQVYGIPIEFIPITCTGKIKLLYIRQWLRLRKMIEDKEKLSARDYNSNTSTNIIVEAPYLNDILFKQGNSFTHHPGNNTLRNVIESKAKQLLEMENNNPQQKFVIKQSKKKDLYLEIMDEVETIHRGRFLYWHKRDDMTDHWWVTLHTGDTNDEKVLLSKIEPLFRKAYTKMQQRHQLQQKLIITKYNNMMQQATTSVTINQNDGRFLFHSLDGKQINTHNGLLSLLHNHHKSKKGNDNDSIKSMTSTASLSSSSSSSSSSLPFIPSRISSSECFGMKFIPCYDNDQIN
jgi:hypothetical protein